MEEKDNKMREEIFSKSVRAGRRTYFFDVRSTRAEDYYMTITESKRHTKEDGSFYYQKHKIYLYKEDFDSFLESLKEVLWIRLRMLKLKILLVINLMNHQKMILEILKRNQMRKILKI